MTLPAGWASASLEDVGTLHCGQSPSARDVNREGSGTPYFTGPEQWDGVKLHCDKWTTDPKRLVPAGCVFITVKGSGVGTLFPGTTGAIGRDIYAFEPENGFDFQFANLALRQNIDSVKAEARGVIPGLTRDDLLGHQIALPPLPEQRRIVTKLDALTAHLTRTRAELSRASLLGERYRRAILAAAFRGELTQEWRHLQKAHTTILPRDSNQIARKYASAGSFLPPYEIPNTWAWLRLPQLGDLDRGKSRHRPRNDARLFGGPYPFIQTGEVRQADRFVTSHSETYSEFGLAQSRLWPVGTVCITIAANIAETAILGIEACFPDSVVGFLPDSDRAEKSYIEFFLRTARAELQAFAPATAQKNINLDTLANVRVPVAPMAEQVEIVRRIEAAFARADRLEAEAARAAHLLDRLEAAILAKAFRGGLVPQDAADEPATTLLARIRQSRATTPKSTRGRRGAV